MKIIPHIKIEGAVELSPLEMNRYHLTDNRSPLKPSKPSKPGAKDADSARS